MSLSSDSEAAAADGELATRTADWTTGGLKAAEVVGTVPGRAGKANRVSWACEDTRHGQWRDGILPKHLSN